MGPWVGEWGSAVASVGATSRKPTCRRCAVWGGSAGMRSGPGGLGVGSDYRKCQRWLELRAVM